MACDVCGKGGVALTRVSLQYQTEDVTEVCAECGGKLKTYLDQLSVELYNDQKIKMVEFIGTLRNVGQQCTCSKRPPTICEKVSNFLTRRKQSMNMKTIVQWGVMLALVVAVVLLKYGEAHAEDTVVTYRYQTFNYDPAVSVVCDKFDGVRICQREQAYPAVSHESYLVLYRYDIRKIQRYLKRGDVANVTDYGNKVLVTFR